jgi:hypothetical protein
MVSSLQLRVNVGDEGSQYTFIRFTETLTLKVFHL